jgi:3-methyladenine DNA glycosylase/8-oxoguanine DNA glycosylase
VANTPAKMVALGEEGLKQHIKTIGLFNSKAKNVIALCEILIAPAFRRRGAGADRDALEKLPGVGRKTANVVMNCRLRPADDLRRRHPYLSASATAPAWRPARRCAAVENRSSTRKRPAVPHSTRTTG